ncbi:MAG: transglutaminase-like domain-containing protein [Burkholderiales bacterium]
MDRRRFLTVSTAGVVASTLGGVGAARVAGESAAPPMKDAPWRTFEIVTDVEIRPQDTPAKLWLPLPLYRDTDYQRTLDIRWSGNPATAGIHRDPKFGAPAFHATWKDTSDAPKLQVVTVVTARNRRVDLSTPGQAQRVAREELELYLQPTTHIPTDGIVRATASRLLPAWWNTLDRARAIYEWIVENTYRDPKVVGCGTGDIRFMLESGDLGGKCADLNSLFVGLSRCAGIPARNVYGVRVADSATWKSLGKSGDITRAQHCRAEFYHPNFGWVPVDPADVRKVILDEEKDQLLPLSDPRVVLARKTLFGAWEMNWMAYNTANDTRLAPQANKALGHFMYPYAEGAKGVLDYYTPQSFKYQMTAREAKS